jgi:hypothetical protein
MRESSEPENNVFEIELLGSAQEHGKPASTNAFKQQNR